MVDFNKTDVVRKGDSPWKVAARNLQANGQKVSNDDIIKEMNRLAQINGCTDVEDFSSNFFSSIGKEVIVDNKQDKPVTPQPKVTPQPTVSPTKKKKIVQHRVKGTVRTDIVKTPEQIHADKINAMSSDTQRIIAHNRTNYQGKYYGIVDKKTCQLKIYDRQGNVVKTYIVGVGRTKGDGLGSYYMDHHNNTNHAHLAENNRYTTAGEFTLDEVQNTTNAYTGKDGKPKVMNLKGDNRGYRGGQMAIHMLYKPQYEKRKAAIESKGLEDNRMSYGCVNLTEEDWNSMHQYLGEGDKLYILPEEKGNKLKLERQRDGSYKFEQLNHRNDRRDMTKEQASKVNYDVRPQRSPNYIAEQKKKGKPQETTSLGQTKPNDVKWYKPWSWFS